MAETWLQQSLTVLDLELTVAKNLVRQSGADRLAGMRRHHGGPPQSGADRLAGMRRHHGGPPILVTEEVVAAFDADHGEACLGERCEQVRARNARNPAHAATVMR